LRDGRIVMRVQGGCMDISCQPSDDGPMRDANTLATVASIIAGFGAAMLAFRLEREVKAGDRGEPMWIAWADWLVIAATILSLALGLLPIVSGLVREPLQTALASAATSAAVVLTVGYVPAILAHYRLILHRGRRGSRQNPEPSERWLTIGFAIAGAFMFVTLLALRLR
jgi:hypothetical protein